MSRQSIVFSAVVAAFVVASLGPVSGADTSISGTVRLSGLASNADAVVYVTQASTTFVPAELAQMDQGGMQFVPHVLPIVGGTTVRFLNSDSTRHNVFSPDHEKYNLGTWRPGQTKEHAFKCAKPPCVYAQLCLLHLEMSAFIVVLQNPFFAVTDKEGHYEIKNVPPGSYTLAVWHVKGEAQPTPVTVEADKSATVNFMIGR
jgi:plastocyanin